jgi:hypothetical protein
VALTDVYTHAEEVPDVQFLADAGQAGWCVVTQNPRMRFNDPEIDAIRRHATKVFCLTRADYPPVTQGLILGRHIMRFRRRIRGAGGCFWRVSERDPLRDLEHP